MLPVADFVLRCGASLLDKLHNSTMGSKLLTPYVFLDTTEFDSNAFNFQTARFKSLRRKVRAGRVYVFVTEVVQREAEAHIKQYAANSYDLLEKFFAKADTRFIKHLTTPPFSTIVNAKSQDIEEGLRQGFNAFMSEAKVTVLPVGHVQADELIRRYFEKQAPFGEGKKKSEFPDAVSLLALKEWCATKGEKIYVVSSDGDVKGFCEQEENLIYLANLDEFLELVELHESALNKRILQILKDHETDIEEAIKDAFATLELVANDWDLDAVISNVSISGVDITRGNLIEVADGEIEYNIKADVSFSADVSQLDMDTAMWDSEDGVLVPWRRTEYSYEGAESIEADMLFRFPTIVESWDDLDMEEVRIHPSVIELDLINYDADWPYK